MSHRTIPLKIAHAKAKLMLDNPYFGSIVSTLELCHDSTLATYKGKGAKLLYNEEYINTLEYEEVEALLASVATQRVLQHQHRAFKGYSKVWQLASELVANAIVVQNGFELPLEMSYQDRFRGMYLEEVYRVLCDEMEDEYVLDNEEQIIHDESLDEEFLEQLYTKFEDTLALPKDLHSILKPRQSHAINWRDKLYRHISAYDKSQFSFFPPNRKYLYRGVYIPSLSSDLLSIVVAIDTSASIDDELLALFLGEIEAIMQNYPHYQIDLIQADHKIQSHEVFTTGETLSYTIKGRGATHFAPTFDYIDEHLDTPTLLLYFSDGMGEFPPHQPPYDVLWVSPKPINVPFGENIVMETKKDTKAPPKGSF